MCSILITNKSLENRLSQVNRFLQLRGPDGTNLHSQNGISFVHNLLSMTGRTTLQPFVADGLVCEFNGEIYNYSNFGDFETDGECLIPLYQEYGKDFIKKLDGEFAICLFDFKKNEAIVSSDVFATKPLWLGFAGKWFAIATYESAITELGFSDSVKLKANTTYVLDLDEYRIKSETSVYDFDLKQYKTKFDDWNDAFRQAIRKRYITSKQKIFIGLSSGYDSGAIACELLDQKAEFKSYSSLGREVKSVLQDRHDLISTHGLGGVIFKATRADYEIAHKYIEDNVEEFNYRTYCDSSDYNEFSLSVKNDHGSNALSMICSMAKKDKRRIYISGMGADEIFSDYGFAGFKKADHSNFGGLFPDDLKIIYPWASFYGSSMTSFLMKEEYISGAYGLEGRYPYLDKMVVQEFLWLSPQLKNENYKSVLHNYLSVNGFPFEKDRKIGFSL